MAETVPYQPGMNLGRAFDLQNMRPGLDIFPDETLSKSKMIERPQTTMRYSVVKKSKDINDILDVSGEISLRVKAGLLKVEGMGSYLKEDRSKENTLEILAKAHVETMTETMTDSTPNQGWNKNVVGSHYIRSITYGGDLIVRIRIEGSDSRHFEEIKAKVDADLKVGGFLDAGAKASFRKMEEDLKASSTIEITFYSTSLQGTMPRDIEGMLQALDSFKDQVMKLNNGKGVPLSCELLPLSHLDPQLPQILKDRSLELQLGTLEDYFDDVVQAKTRLERFMEREDLDMTDDQEAKGAEILERIEEVESAFKDVIHNLDVTSGGKGPSQMEPAFKMYKEKKKPRGFQQEVVKFMRSAQPQPKDEPHTTHVKDLPPGVELDLVLLGKTGHGKSATANSILGDERFHSHMSSESVTAKCQKEVVKVGGRPICLVDTPGTMDTKSPKETLVEVGTAIAFSPDGYHAFLVVLRVDARMTKEEQMAIVMLKKLFGPDVLMRYGILVFTHGDSFYSQQRKSKIKRTFKDFIKSQGGDLAKLLTETNHRCVLINNMEEDPGKLREQIIELIHVIDNLQAHNEGKKYTNDLFEEAKKELQAEEQRERDDAAKKEKDKLDAARDEGKNEAVAEQKTKEEKVGEKVANKAVSSGRGCFPADVEVMLETGKIVKMASVNVGDRVLACISNGKKEFSEVYFFGHRDEYGISKYINVSTSRGVLRLTPDHHMYVVSDDKRYTLPSEQIQIRDHILILNPSNNTLEEDIVTNLSTSTEIGVYSPLTISGTIFVNNMFVSCYGDYVSPGLSHKLLWPIRQLYYLSPSLSSWLNAPGTNGMPGWVKWCMDKIILPYRNE